MVPTEDTHKVVFVVEGMFTTEAAYDLAKREQVEMPITEQLYNVINGKTEAKDTVDLLMGREKKHEQD